MTFYNKYDCNCNQNLDLENSIAEIHPFETTSMCKNETFFKKQNHCRVRKFLNIKYKIYKKKLMYNDKLA